MAAMRSWLKIIMNAARGWQEDNAFKHSASVSFYTLFSLAPMTVIAVGIAGFFLGGEEADRQFHAQLEQLVGRSSAVTIQEAVRAREVEAEKSWLATMIGTGLLLVGATTVFAQLQQSLNAIWRVRTKPNRSGWLVIVGQRLISFAMVVTVGFILLVSLIVTTMLTAFSDRFHSDWVPVVAHGAEFVVALAVVTVLFAAVFKILPDVKLRWRDVWGSALLTALLFSGGRYLIALYLGHSTVASVYGAAGSLVALLMWVYYSCAILFFGVEFTKAYRLERKLKIIPKATAVAVREEIVSDEG